LARVSRSYLAINAEEAIGIGLVDGERARILTPWGEAVATIKASQRMRRDAVVFVLSFYDVAVARLVGSEIDPQSLVPAYAGIPARVEKA
jgi:predicted molibdopterin-dependent oxidoreductase YjgC